MRQRVLEFGRRRPVTAATCAIALLALSTLGVVAAQWLFGIVRFSHLLTELRAERPARESALSEANPASVSRIHFRYAGATRFVEVPVSSAELASARDLDTRRVFASSRVVRGAYLRALVADESSGAIVPRVAARLAALRDKLELDDDQYVELMARYVQSIPYGEVDGRVRPPAQVLAENVAACDDRSVLLASLLVHEGFDTALFTFEGQSHAAVGVRSVDRGFRGTGYAFIETTRPAFVGEVGSRYVGYAAWRPLPHVVRVGGRTRYTAEAESSFIARQLEDARRRARYLARYKGLSNTGPTRWRRTYRAAEREQVEAQQLVALIEAYDFDREAIHDLLLGRAAGL